MIKCKMVTFHNFKFIYFNLDHINLHIVVNVNIFPIIIPIPTNYNFQFSIKLLMLISCATGSKIMST